MPLSPRCSYAARPNGNAFKSLEALRLGLPADLRVKNAIFDGEICCLDSHGKSVFDDLFYRCRFERTATLYHFAMGTPRKKLVWAPLAGGRWRIDWQRTRRDG